MHAHLSLPPRRTPDAAASFFLHCCAMVHLGTNAPFKASGTANFRVLALVKYVNADLENGEKFIIFA